MLPLHGASWSQSRIQSDAKWHDKCGHHYVLASSLSLGRPIGAPQVFFNLNYYNNY